MAGISGYGNSVGVPTVGGELTFSPGYARNPLVNVLCLGVMPTERLVLGAATGEGNLAVLLGSTTGRDGIGGVSVLASAAFGGDSDSDADADAAKRPSVQVGDPFEEKRLIEACLELLDRGLVVGIQDLGGAGLTCATSETAARGGMGMDVYVDVVPRREPAMEPFEVMTSESQERMLAIVTPADRAAVEEVCRRWEVRATVIGTVTAPPPAAGGRLRILDGEGAVLADVPAHSLSDDAPLYDRVRAAPAGLDERRRRRSRPGPAGERDTAECRRRRPRPARRRVVGVPPVRPPALPQHRGGAGGGRRGVAPRRPGPAPEPARLWPSPPTPTRGWCALDPRLGTAMTVAESALNVACAGARPVALVNCLNFGNPEHPQVMWQLSESVDGMAEACRALEIPVIGGNVSLYNASGGNDIDPTPVVAVLGVVDHLERRPPGMGFTPGSTLVLLGDTVYSDGTLQPDGTLQSDETVQPDGAVHSLAGSRWAVECHGHDGGTLPALDLAAHARLLALLVDLVPREGMLSSVHDVSGGGLALALAECAVRSGVGCVVDAVTDYAELLSESPPRVVVGTDHPDEVLARATSAGVPARVIGTTGGDRVVVTGLLDLSVAAATEVWRSALPGALGEAVTD